jgi:type VI secretion system secreted protein Hcp
MRLNTTRWVSLLSLLLGSLFCSSSFAAMYLCIDGIKGDVTAQGYADCIAIDSFSDSLVRSFSQVGGGGGREATLPSLSEISLTKSLDSSSVELRKQAAIGKALNINIHFVQTGADSICEYYNVQLEDGIFSSHSMSNGAEQPYESLTINFTRIRYTLYQNDIKGCGSILTTWGWNVATGAPL